MLAFSEAVVSGHFAQKRSETVWAETVWERIENIQKRSGRGAETFRNGLERLQKRSERSGKSKTPRIGRQESNQLLGGPCKGLGSPSGGFWRPLGPTSASVGTRFWVCQRCWEAPYLKSLNV